MKKLSSSSKRSARLTQKTKASFDKAWRNSVKLADLSMYASGELPCGCGGNGGKHLIGSSLRTSKKL